MLNPLYIGLLTEGPTDQRFFEPLIERLTREIIDKLQKSIKFEILPFRKPPGGFADLVKAAVEQAKDQGNALLLIHLDADAPDDSKVRKHKIQPANQILAQHQLQPEPVYLIPVYETEAWLLADRDLLRKNLRTQLDDRKLNWTFSNPESLSDPKATINQAVTLVNQGRRARQRVDLAQLYGPLGNSIELHKLRTLASFNRFEDDYQQALAALL